MTIASPPSLTARVLTQTLAFVVFLVVPTVVTLIAPFTDLGFRHEDTGVSVTVRRYALMVVPWQTREIRNVAALAPETTREFRYRDTAENRRKDRVGTVSHATGQLVVLGEGQEVVVQAAPELVQAISTRFERFRNDRSEAPLTLSVYASWRLSYLLGGAMTGLAAFYVLSVCLALLSLPLKAVRGAT